MLTSAEGKPVRREEGWEVGRPEGKPLGADIDALFRILEGRPLGYENVDKLDG